MPKILSLWFIVFFDCLEIVECFRGIREKYDILYCFSYSSVWTQCFSSSPPTFRTSEGSVKVSEEEWLC